MEVSISLSDGLALTIADPSSGARDDGTSYPTRRLQRGLVLCDRGQELGEEGIGFGVPVLKLGIQTVFPGAVELTVRRDDATTVVRADFAMNLVERLAGPSGAQVRSRRLYAVKNSLAALHRSSPALRRPLTATSSTLRRAFGWVTTFAETRQVAALTMMYAARAGEGRVGVSLQTADAPLAGVTEVVVMNEQGGRCFDAYTDTDGVELRAGSIGTWDLVTAAQASFASGTRGVAFSLGQVDGARLYRGRELIGSRVAWSGFGYSLPPTRHEFAYELRIERTR